MRCLRKGVINHDQVLQLIRQNDLHPLPKEAPEFSELHNSSTKQLEIHESIYDTDLIYNFDYIAE